MSHGGDQPNLTPLLDVVLQLLMFFMMCVNFVSEQVSDTVALPTAQSARPIDPHGSYLFLNLNRHGELMVPGQDALTTRGEACFYLRGRFADAERVATGSALHVSVVIRADAGADYGKVYDLLSICKEVGFRKLELRAQQRAAG